MPLDTWFLYVGAVLLLMSKPGPSQLQMLSNSLANGVGRASFTAMGDLSPNMLQMFAAGLGLAAIIVASEAALTAIKLAGAAYLLCLGARLISRGKASGTNAPRICTSLRTIWMQGFLTSAANPKAVVFLRQSSRSSSPRTFHSGHSLQSCRPPT